MPDSMLFNIVSLLPADTACLINPRTSGEMLEKICRALPSNVLLFAPNSFFPQETWVAAVSVLKSGAMLPHFKPPNTKTFLAMVDAAPEGVVCVFHSYISKAALVAAARTLKPDRVFRTSGKIKEDILLDIIKSISEGVIFQPNRGNPLKLLITIVAALRPGVIFRPPPFIAPKKVAEAVSHLPEGVILQLPPRMPEETKQAAIRALPAGVIFEPTRDQSRPVTALAMGSTLSGVGVPNSVNVGQAKSMPDDAGNEGAAAYCSASAQVATNALTVSSLTDTGAVCNEGIELTPIE